MSCVKLNSFWVCLVFLFECVHMLIKIVQGGNVFVCDFVESVKQMQQKLYYYIVIFTLGLIIWLLMILMLLKCSLMVPCL
jgi:hypothetical protein